MAAQNSEGQGGGKAGGGSEGNGENLQKALVGAAAVAAVAGVALFAGRKLRAGAETDAPISDAPPSTFRGAKRSEGALISRTVTINKPADILYDFWRDFDNLPRFMENVRAVEKLDETRARWTIAAPAGTEISFVSRVTEDRPGELIAWEAEEGSEIRSRGRVEFIEAAPGRGTMVRATIDYDPPGGKIGRLVAKLFQREPGVQARRELRRFKQLMETGEITNSAGPSGRTSEDPAEQNL